MDSCGVGVFSLNYGPQTTRGKSPYASDPCPSRAVPTTREPHTVQLTTLLSDFRAAKFQHSQVSVDRSRLSLRHSNVFDIELTTLQFFRHKPIVPLRPATSCANRVTLRFVIRASLENDLVVQQDPRFHDAVTRKKPAHENRECCVLLSCDDEPILQHGSPDGSLPSASRIVR